MQELKKKGPSNENLNKVKEQLIRERETDIKKNNWWVRKLENLYYFDDPKTSLDDYNIQVNKVTPKDIQDLANKYFNETNFFMANSSRCRKLYNTSFNFTNRLVFSNH